MEVGEIQSPLALEPIIKMKAYTSKVCSGIIIIMKNPNSTMVLKIYSKPNCFDKLKFNLHGFNQVNEPTSGHTYQLPAKIMLAHAHKYR